MKRLCIVPCGSKKVWDKAPSIGATEARHAYIGTFHKACQQYALQFFSDWVILSAKYVFDNSKLAYPLSDCKGIGFMVQKLQRAVQEKKEILFTPSSKRQSFIEVGKSDEAQRRISLQER
ncbi:MAG: hypothetical protein BAA01_04950 [Bacillus thermozeamaize]|uniref:Uncharacterized protein n=1 Tax=Bacillus thermozeamaize TaxID=230954 RepID=A0A1Y3PJS3_9BACI|nr:MAG: hypothetical protein BAA01_04950 [Bacillus thermozeamaize]